MTKDFQALGAALCSLITGTMAYQGRNFERVPGNAIYDYVDMLTSISESSLLY